MNNILFSEFNSFVILVESCVTPIELFVTPLGFKPGTF